MSELDPPRENVPLSYRGARHLVQFALLVIVAWFLVRSLQSVLLLFAVVFLLAMVLNPIVVWLEKFRVPRLASVVLLLLVLAALAVIIGLIAIPPIASQLQDLVRRAPEVWHRIRLRIDSFALGYPAIGSVLPQTDEIAGQIGAQTGAVANMLLRSTIGFVGGLFSVIFGVLLLAFVLSNPRPLILGYLALVPDRHREAARRSLTRFMEQVIGWARGVIINGAISGISTGILLWLIGVQPVLVFAALTFLGQIVPPIGPMILSLPALFVALSMGPTKFWLTLAAILFVQQVVTTVTVPYIFGKGMRLNPVVILFFTLAAASVLGIPGAVLAIPAAALVQIVVDEFYLRPRQLDYARLDRDAGCLARGEHPRDTSNEFPGEI